jgi:hypothetical protein
MPDNYVSPLDEYMQQNSIMYKGTKGNKFNTTIDEYYIQTEGHSVQAFDPNLGCSACYNPNPPQWCFNPNDPCYDSSIPIEPGFFMLVLSFLFGSFLIQKRFGFSKV